jgi:hypothetical protein
LVLGGGGLQDEFDVPRSSGGRGGVAHDEVDVEVEFVGL